MKLNQITEPISLDDLRKNQVKLIQRLLNKKGAKLVITGFANSVTKEALEEFKVTNNLEKDSLLDAETYKLLQQKLETKEEKVEEKQVVQEKYKSTKPKRKVSNEALGLIYYWQKPRLHSYLSPDHKWVIGYGNSFYENGQPVKRGDCICKEKAQKLYQAIIQDMANFIHYNIDTELTENQFGALVCFGLCYSVGKEALSQSYIWTLLKEGKVDEVAKEIKNWGKITYKSTNGRMKRRTIPKLVNRRQAEVKLFLK